MEQVFVTIGLKDKGHSINFNGRLLRGDDTIDVEETEQVKQLRQKGLITTKVIAKAPVSIPDEKPFSQEAKEEDKQEQKTDMKPGNSRKTRILQIIFKKTKRG